MRIAFIGATEVSVATAHLLVERGHEIVIIDTDRDRIDELSGSIDCSFLHGDGSKPDILGEVDPEGTDVLFCLTNHDQVNILASLVGRSLGFQRVVTSVQNEDYEPICRELGIEDMLVPVRTISRYFADLVRGIDVLELSTVIRGEARFFRFRASGEEPRTVGELDLPSDARVICTYRDGEFRLADRGTDLREDDEVVVLTHSRNLPELRDRWQLIY